MFLKQEGPEMDDFEEEKNFVSKGKILSIFLTLIPLQKYHKMFLHILLIQNVLSVFYFEKKTSMF